MSIHKPLKFILAASIITGLTACSGTATIDGTEYALPELPTEVTELVPSEITELIPSELQSLDDKAIADIADKFSKEISARLGKTPEEFAQMTPEEIANLVEEAAKDNEQAVRLTLEEIKQLTPSERTLIAQNAQLVLSGAIDEVASSAKEVLAPAEANVGTIRFGINSLGGYAASAAYLWIYMLNLAGYHVEYTVATGAELAAMLNNGDLDVTFEAVPEFLDEGTEVLGLWSDGRLNVQGRKGISDDFETVSNGLTNFALTPEKMRSLAAIVDTRGVSNPATQQAAVQLWLLENPEVIAGIVTE